MVDIFTLKDLTVEIPSQKEDDPTEKKEDDDNGE